MLKFVFIFLIMNLSSVAYSCAACGFSDDSRGAFLSTAVMMTFVPLIVLGGIFYFVYKRVRSLEVEDEKARLAHRDSTEHISSY